MAYLLDTHTLIWLLDEPEQLSSKAHSAIMATEHPLHISIASLWEIAIKAGLDKLELSISFSEILDQLALNEVNILPILPEHLSAYLNLPLHHKDPFDRILVAQASMQDLTIITRDKAFHLYNIPTLW